MRYIALIASTVMLFVLASCGPKSEEKGTTAPKDMQPSAASGKTFKIGYVLHGLNPFTEQIKRGAEDAGKKYGVEVEVTGPSSFDTVKEAQDQFEGMVQKKKGGLVVIPMPGNVWVRTIKEAADAGIPVLTANITSEGSASESWFGQDEYQSGVILAGELKKMLEAQGKKSGKIVVGICKADVEVLVDRFKGFKKGMEGTAFTIPDAKEVGVENTANYAQWENLASANRDMVALVGLCSMDVPNMSKLKDRLKAKWLIAGYDLTKESLDSIKSGATQLLLGQNPYLQGYLPVAALAEHLKDKKPLPKGWIDVGTEIITKDNVDKVYGRDTDTKQETAWYADHVAKNFKDISSMGKPMPKH